MRHPSDSSSVSSRRSDIESPRHFRPIGRVLSHNVADGMTTIELIRPPHGPYGIYLARDGEDALNSELLSVFSPIIMPASQPSAWLQFLIHSTSVWVTLNNASDERDISYPQGWVFATAKSIFARTVEKLVKTTVKTGKNWQ